MRALSYFQFDENARAGDPTEAKTLALSFEAYCQERGHAPLGVFRDALHAGERNGYHEMVEHIRETGLGYLVVVPSVAHFGRELHEQIDRVLELDVLHCQVLCDDPEAPDPLQGAMRLWSGTGIGSRRERIREGMRAKAARGLGLGKPPYGFRVQYDGTFRTVAEEAEVIRWIFQMYLDENLGIRSVAQRLNHARKRTRQGRRWSMVTVRDILRNRAYIGTYQRFGLRITGPYEAIIDPTDFRRVQDKMTSRSPGRRRARSQPFLLAGLLHCAYCGQRMMGVTRYQTWRRKDGERRDAEYRYYQCQSRINRSQCDYRTVKAAEVEAQVLAQLRLLGIEDNLPEGEGMATERSRAISRLRGIERRYVDYVRMAASGAIPLERVRPALADLSANRKAVEGRLALLERGGDALHGAVSGAREALTQTSWSALDPVGRQEVMRTLLVKATIKDGHVDVVSRGLAPISEV